MVAPLEITSKYEAQSTILTGKIVKNVIGALICRKEEQL